MILLACRVVHLCLLDYIQAIDTDDIDCLSNIEALRKAAMVSVEESQYVLLRSLISLIHFYSLIYQLKWVDHKGNTVQKLTFSCFLEYIGIKFLLVGFRDDIPCLCGASMAVIDRVEP